MLSLWKEVKRILKKIVFGLILVLCSSVVLSVCDTGTGDLYITPTNWQVGENIVKVYASGITNWCGGSSGWSGMTSASSTFSIISMSIDHGTCTLITNHVAGQTLPSGYSGLIATYSCTAEYPGTFDVAIAGQWGCGYYCYGNKQYDVASVACSAGELNTCDDFIPNGYCDESQTDDCKTCVVNDNKWAIYYNSLSYSETTNKFITGVKADYYIDNGPTSSPDACSDSKTLTNVAFNACPEKYFWSGWHETYTFFTPSSSFRLWTKYELFPQGGVVLMDENGQILKDFGSSFFNSVLGYYDLQAGKKYVINVWRSSDAPGGYYADIFFAKSSTSTAFIPSTPINFEAEGVIGTKPVTNQWENKLDGTSCSCGSGAEGYCSAGACIEIKEGCGCNYNDGTEDICIPGGSTWPDNTCKVCLEGSCLPDVSWNRVNLKFGFSQYERAKFLDKIVYDDTITSFDAPFSDDVGVVNKILDSKGTSACHNYDTREMTSAFEGCYPGETIEFGDVVYYWTYFIPDENFPLTIYHWGDSSSYVNIIDVEKHIMNLEAGGYVPGEGWPYGDSITWSGWSNYYDDNANILTHNMAKGKLYIIQYTWSLSDHSGFDEATYGQAVKFQDTATCGGAPIQLSEKGAMGTNLLTCGSKWVENAPDSSRNACECNEEWTWVDSHTWPTGQCCGDDPENAAGFKETYSDGTVTRIYNPALNSWNDLKFTTYNWWDEQFKRCCDDYQCAYVSDWEKDGTTWAGSIIVPLYDSKCFNTNEFQPVEDEPDDRSTICRAGDWMGCSETSLCQYILGAFRSEDFNTVSYIYEAIKNYPNEDSSLDIYWEIFASDSSLYAGHDSFFCTNLDGENYDWVRYTGTEDDCYVGGSYGKCEPYTDENGVDRFGCVLKCGGEASACTSDDECCATTVDTLGETYEMYCSKTSSTGETISNPHCCPKGEYWYEDAFNPAKSECRPTGGECGINDQQTCPYINTADYYEGNVPLFGTPMYVEPQVNTEVSEYFTTITQCIEPRTSKTLSCCFREDLGQPGWYKTNINSY